VNKKTFMAATAAILFVTLTVAVLIIFVEANSGSTPETLASQDWVSISFPISKTYNINNITLRFNNEHVASLFWDNTGLVVDYSNIAYFLDGIMLAKVAPIVELCRWSHAVNLTGLADGQHSVDVRGTVTATKDLYFCGVNAKQGDSYDFSDEVTFTVDTTPTLSPTTLPSPSPLELTLEPTVEPTSTYAPTSDDTQVMDWAPVALATVVVAAAVALGTLVYFCKHKRS
jgi:hypothetical protein